MPWTGQQAMGIVAPHTAVQPEVRAGPGVVGGAGVAPSLSGLRTNPRRACEGLRGCSLPLPARRHSQHPSVPSWLPGKLVMLQVWGLSPGKMEPH